jgi:hypothetical protein
MATSWEPPPPVLPDAILEAVIGLHRAFERKIDDFKDRRARASGLFFFNRFYQLTDHIPTEYALYAIAAFHLGTKVCDVCVRLKAFVREIADDAEDLFGRFFRILDGIPPRPQLNFDVSLVELLVKCEMNLIDALDFNFAVKIPHDFSSRYIHTILRWHFNEDGDTFPRLERELSRMCGIFLNDLEYQAIFYTHEAEMIALAGVQMTFDRFQLPLVSPKDRPWWTFLAPI